VGPFLTNGEIVVVRWMVPLNPFVPLMVMVYVAEDPRLMVWVVGVAVIVKSGGEVTVTDTIFA
jgi:hypothetical protein